MSFSSPPPSRVLHSLPTVVVVLAIACSGCTLPKIRPAKPGETSETIVVADGDPDAAEQQRSPSRREAIENCLAAAREMEAHGQDRAAIEQYERARSFQIKPRGISHRLALLYERQEDREKAAVEYAAALKENPVDADVWNDFAHFRFDDGNYRDAEAAARTALRLDPNHKLAGVNLALSLVEQEGFDEALPALSQAVGPAAARTNWNLLVEKRKAKHREGIVAGDDGETSPTHDSATASTRGFPGATHAETPPKPAQAPVKPPRPDEPTDFARRRP